MPAPTDPKADQQTKNDNLQQDAGASLNAPRVDPSTGKATQRAVSRFKQAHGIAKNLYQRAKEGRLANSAKIRQTYDGRQPFEAEDLRKTGQTWRNNFSINSLASIIDRTKPQFMDPVQEAGAITFSVLPDDVPDSAEKSNTFRKIITKTIRAWQGWPDFLSLLSQEVILEGNACPGWIDPHDWRPRMYSYDHVFLPEGTWQHSSKAALVVFAQEILLWQFLEMISDPEAAEIAGYDMEGCCKAANEAAGLEAKGELTPIERQDRIREMGTFGASYDTAVKNVDIYHLLVVDYNGGVDLWSVSQKTGHPIRHIEGIYETFPEAATFFTFQTGNGKYYGSKGLGRLLTNIHIARERNWNFAYDAFYLSQFPIATGDPTIIKTAKFTVKHPVMMAPTGLTFVKETVPFDVEGWKNMDGALVETSEAIAGAFVPNSDPEGAANTKIEAAQNAERQMAVREGVLGRFFSCMADLVGAIQQKICSPDNVKEAWRIYKKQQDKKKSGIRMLMAKLANWLKSIVGEEALKDQNVEGEETSAIADPEAVNAILEMLNKGLTLEDIGQLAMCPAGNAVESDADAEDQKMIALCQQKIQEQSPYFDQKELNRVMAETMIGSDRAKLLLRKDQYDPSDTAQQTRQQVIEFSEMLSGNYMPVAKDDIHRIHRSAMRQSKQGGGLDAIIQSLQGALTPELLSVAQFLLSHYAGHVSLDDTMTPDERAQEAGYMKQNAELFQQAQKRFITEMHKAAKEGGVAPGQGPSALTAPTQAQLGPDGNAQGAMTSEGLVTLAADMQMHKDNIALKSRELDLKERQQHHSEQMDMFDATANAQHKVNDAIANATQQGIQDANRDAQQAVQAQQAPPAQF